MSVWQQYEQALAEQWDEEQTDECNRLVNTLEHEHEIYQGSPAEGAATACTDRPEW